MKPPVLIEIELLGDAPAVVNPTVLPTLAALNQAGRSLVLLSKRPDGWKPTRNRVDQAFKQQSELEATFNRGGGMLDAILYLDFSLFSRQKQRMAALKDLASRYDCEVEQLRALCRADGRMAEVIAECQIPLLTIDKKHNLQQRIEQILTQPEKKNSRR